ncbi:hypothetical protein BN8_06012 [Fibrisoma limi BUZ 3]|nr:hypothetical protein BN8_06012 [Fibrisoma limi BUZ 3]
MYWVNERIRMKWFGKKDPALELKKQPEEELV